MTFCFYWLCGVGHPFAYFCQLVDCLFNCTHSSLFTCWWPHWCRGRHRKHFSSASLNCIPSCPTTSLPLWTETSSGSWPLKFKIVMTGQFSTLAVFFESLRHKIASNYPSTSVTSVTTSPSTSLYTFLPKFTRALSSSPWGNPSGRRFCKSDWVTVRKYHICIHYPLLFTRPLLQEGSSLQVEILSICLFVCPS